MSQETITKISYLLIEHDKKINTNEQLLLNVFSYLYNKIDEVSLKIDECNNKINVSILSYSSSVNKITDINETTDVNKKTDVNETTDVNKKTDVNKTEHTNNKIVRKKKHRSLLYYIIKPYKYKQLLKKKLILESEIAYKNKIKQEIIEAERKKQEEMIKRTNEKRTSTRNQISKILKKQ